MTKYLKSNVKHIIVTEFGFPFSPISVWCVAPLRGLHLIESQIRNFEHSSFTLVSQAIKNGVKTWIQHSATQVFLIRRVDFLWVNEVGINLSGKTCLHAPTMSINLIICVNSAPGSHQRYSTVTFCSIILQ